MPTWRASQQGLEWEGGREEEGGRGHAARTRKPASYKHAQRSRPNSRDQRPAAPLSWHRAGCGQGKVRNAPSGLRSACGAWCAAARSTAHPVRSSYRRPGRTGGHPPAQQHPLRRDARPAGASCAAGEAQAGRACARSAAGSLSRARGTWARGAGRGAGAAIGARRGRPVHPATRTFSPKPGAQPAQRFFYQPSACPCAAVVRAARPARVFSLMGRLGAVRCAG